MDIDNTATTDTVDASSSTATETSQVSPAQSDNLTQAAPASGTDREPDAGQIQPTLDDGSKTSLTPPNNEVPQSAQVDADKWKSELETYRKRMADKDRYIHEQSARIKEYQNNYNGVDAATIRAFREQQQRAQQEKLPVWNSKHPSNGAFHQTLAKYKAFKQAFNAASDDTEKAVISKTFGAAISPEEKAQVEQWENHRASYADKFAADPEGTIAEMVEQRAQAVFERMRQSEKVNQDVNQWFDSPDNQPLVQRMAPAMEKALQDGVPFKYVQAMAQQRQAYDELAAKLDALQNRVVEKDKVVNASQERDRILRQQAAITRDPSAKRFVDPRQVAKERGIKPNTTQYQDLLFELDSQGLLPS